MKYLLSIFFISTSLFANYSYQGVNGGKIDMHGGKKQKLIEKTSNLSNKSFMLSNIGLKDNLKKDMKKQKKQKTDTK